MKDKKSISISASLNEIQSNENPTNPPRKTSRLLKILEDELKEIYLAEKALNKEIDSNS